MQHSLRLPQELKHFGNNYGEVSLIENPYPFSRYEVWMTRIDWEGWRRVLGTEDLSTARHLFGKAVHVL